MESFASIPWWAWAAIGFFIGFILSRAMLADDNLYTGDGRQVGGYQPTGNVVGGPPSGGSDVRPPICRGDSEWRDQWQWRRRW